MFPLTANEPYIKETGERSTLGAELGSGGGGGSLPIASASTLGGVKIGSGINVTEDGTISSPGSQLPVATAEILGGVKIGSGINVAEDGTISTSGGGGSATKIYYKDHSITWGTNVQLAQFEGSAASGSGFFAARSGGTGIIDVAGYTPISAIAIDKYTGYYFAVFIEKYGNSHKISMALSSRGIDADSCGVRVFYVKNEDLEVLT